MGPPPEEEPEPEVEAPPEPEQTVNQDYEVLFKEFDPLTYCVALASF